MCKSCLVVIKQKNNIRRHEQACSGGLKPLYICAHCDKQFLYKSKLQRHLDQGHKKLRTSDDIDFDDPFLENDDYLEHMADDEEEINETDHPDFLDPDSLFIMLPDGSVVPLGDSGGENDPNENSEIVVAEDQLVDTNGSDGSDQEVPEQHEDHLETNHVDQSGWTHVSETPPPEGCDQNSETNNDETRRKRIQRKKTVLKDFLKNQ